MNQSAWKKSTLTSSTRNVNLMGTVGIRGSVIKPRGEVTGTTFSGGWICWCVYTDLSNAQSVGQDPVHSTRFHLSPLQLEAIDSWSVLPQSTVGVIVELRRVGLPCGHVTGSTLITPSSCQTCHLYIYTFCHDSKKHHQRFCVLTCYCHRQRIEVCVCVCRSDVLVMWLFRHFTLTPS